MAYSTSTEVQSDFKNLVFSTTTLVTTADVEGFITEADALINSYVGQKYTTPITAVGDALNLMKLCSRTLVRDRIKQIMEVKQLQNTTANQETRGGFGTSNVMKLLEKIAKGELKLADAAELIEGGAFYSSNYACDVEPVFRKDCKDW